MGLKTGSTSSGRKDPAEDGYEFPRALRAMGEETLMTLSRLNLTRAWCMFFMAGTRNLVVLCGSTKTSLPTAMASTWVLGW